MPEKKGLELPSNAVIVIAIGVILLVAIGAFILSASTSSMSRVEAERIFATGCARYCKPDLYQTFKSAYQASQNDHEFVNACIGMGYMSKGEENYANRCLSQCGNCNFDINSGDIDAGFDRLDALTSRG